MACRVGITTNPERRKQEWISEYPNLTGWTILGSYSSKSAAQDRENREAASRGCVSSPGGSGPEYATWYVYYFRY